jgi:hypothetical protein
VTAKSKDGQTGTAKITYTVAGPPTASITSPADNQTYNLGQSVATAFSCTEDPNGPGIQSCTDSGGGSSPAGQLDTSKAGTFTYTVTAKSKDGQTGTAKITYTVAYGFGGFTSPLPKGTMTYQSGSSIPAKFTLTDASGHPISASIAATLASQLSVTLSGPTGGTAITPVTAPCSWNSTNLFFQCNLKTPTLKQIGSKYPYQITAYENLGGTNVKLLPYTTGAADVNPETVFFK